MTKSHSIPIADLHCDLLEHLARPPGRSPFDRAARCSIPQLGEGNVRFQVLAIFALTEPGPAEAGRRQARLFRGLIRDHRQSIADVQEASDLARPDDRRIGVLAAVESGSAFCGEDEPLEDGFDRLLEIERLVGGLLYVSLTWHNRNRFGGGNRSKAGLSPDGARLLELLAERRIAVDLSHTSHRLAVEILEEIDARGLGLPVLASHSNFRAVVDDPRNLADDVAREIIARDGVIGLNFVSRFLGPTAEQGLIANVEHALALGAARALAFGADFFNDTGIPGEPKSYFFPELGEPADYPLVFRLLERRGLATGDFATDLAHGNVHRFLGRILLGRDATAARARSATTSPGGRKAPGTG